MHPFALRVLLLCVLLAPLALAQEASLTGAVTDPSGAALTGVEVTVTQTERNVSATATTGADGRFRFPRLPIGSYRVAATAQGFKSFEQSDVLLTTNLDALLNIVMQLGAITERITVSAEASRVSTETATMQQLVDNRRILDLPLMGRNVYSLATLVPGTGSSGTNIGGGRSASQNSTMVNVRVDGALNVDNAHSNILPSPSPDAVQEFTIQTSVSPARYGYAAGVIEVSTRSGTNNLHGSIYEFVRNDAFDSRSFFDAAKVKRKRNQYGFAGGGPVWLPKIYDGRNRTFWFVNIEQQKEPLNASTVIYVPTAAQRTGDFSGQSKVVRDPITNQPFPGNVIPQSRLDPLALNLLRQYAPEAQDALGTHRYMRPNDNNPTQVLARGDQILGGGRHQVSGRLFITRNVGPLASGSLPAFSQGVQDNQTDLAGVTYTSNLAANKINVARFSANGYYRKYRYSPRIELADLKKLGYGSNYYTYTSDFPSMDISGAFSLAAQYPELTYDNNTYSFSDDFSWIRGRHTLQFGIDGVRTVQNSTNVSRTQGHYTFNGSLSGVALADFILGRPSAFRQGSPAPDNPRGLMVAWYVQDDFKVHSRLTLNLGLRHEMPFPTTSLNNAMILYQPGAKSQVYVNAHPGMLFYGDPGVPRGGRERQKMLFNPRIGLAYALTGDQKTTLRLGYGIYVNPPWTNIDGQFAIYQPFSRIVDIATPPSTSDPWANWPGGNPHPYTPSKNSVFDQQITGLSYAPGYKDTTMQQWNLNLQREIMRDWLVTAGYVGTRASRIPYLRDINAAVYIPGQSTVSNVNQRRPLYPYFSRLSMIESVVNSTYHSLQLSVDKRFAKGFSVLTSYTFSKTLTDLNTVLTNDGGVQDPNNRRLEWGPASFDRSHAFTSSWVWNVPAGRFSKGAAGVVLGGWQLNGILAMYSGAPLSITASQDRALRGQPNRPDRLSDASLSTDRSRAEYTLRYFNTSAYAPNQAGQFGSAPRAESKLRAPGSVNLTVGVMKNFRGLAESHRVQFRGELNNLPNRPNFNAPGANIDSTSSFGRITSAGDGRVIQLGLKYIF